MQHFSYPLRAYTCLIFFSRGKAAGLNTSLPSPAAGLDTSLLSCVNASYTSVKPNYKLFFRFCCQICYSNQKVFIMKRSLYNTNYHGDEQLKWSLHEWLENRSKGPSSECKLLVIQQQNFDPACDSFSVSGKRQPMTTQIRMC